MTSSTFAGSGRLGYNTVEAPTWNGKYSALPRPYAKNSLATEKVRSSGPISSTCRPNASQQTSISWCRWTAALGVPVVPEVYCQNATSSLVVAAGASSGRDRKSTRLSSHLVISYAVFCLKKKNKE